MQVLGGLDAVGERCVVQGLVHPGAEEPDQRARLSQGDMAERGPGREHPAGGGVPQVDEIGQMGGLVRGHRGGDLDHLQEGDRALLHAGAAGGGQGDEGQSPGRGPFGGRGQALPGGHPDRPAQETELAGGHGHPVTADPALAGDHRFIQAGPFPGRGQIGGVGRIRPHVGGCGVPGPERARIQ